MVVEEPAVVARITTPSAQLPIVAARAKPTLALISRRLNAT